MRRCRCGHDGSRHAPGPGPCQVRLDALPAEELPEWRCPCPRLAVGALVPLAALARLSAQCDETCTTDCGACKGRQLGRVS